MIITNVKILFVLLTLVLATACGKKMTESEKQSQKQERKVTLTVQEDVSPTTTYQVPKNGSFKLPAKLKAKIGNAMGKKIEIFYNHSSSSDYEFSCTYSSTDKIEKLTLDGCKSSNGDEIISGSDDLNHIWVSLDKGTQVKLQLTNPSGDKMTIESAYLVDWK